jgi:hypothetical protein
VFSGQLHGSQLPLRCVPVAIFEKKKYCAFHFHFLAHVSLNLLGPYFIMRGKEEELFHYVSIWLIRVLAIKLFFTLKYRYELPVAASGTFQKMKNSLMQVNLSSFWQVGYFGLRLSFFIFSRFSIDL